MGARGGACHCGQSTIDTSWHGAGTADLIYTFSPRFGEYCPEAIALATRFDQDCNRLSNAVEVADLEIARAILTGMLDWLLGVVTSPSDRADCAMLLAELSLATDMDGLLRRQHRSARLCPSMCFLAGTLSSALAILEE
jgi:hypothetical protein